MKRSVAFKPIKSRAVKAKPVDCIYGCGRKDLTGRGICRECWRVNHRRALKEQKRKASPKTIRKVRKHG